MMEEAQPPAREYASPGSSLAALDISEDASCTNEMLHKKLHQQAERLYRIMKATGAERDALIAKAGGIESLLDMTAIGLQVAAFRLGALDAITPPPQPTRSPWWPFKMFNN
jgi:hypothetical protein